MGELGYELHMRNEDCVPIFRALMDVGKSKGLRNAGYRALYSLSSEKGKYLKYIILLNLDIFTTHSSCNIIQVHVPLNIRIYL